MQPKQALSCIDEAQHDEVEIHPVWECKPHQSEVPLVFLPISGLQSCLPSVNQTPNQVYHPCQSTQPEIVADPKEVT